MRCLSREEIGALLSAAEEPVRTLLALSLATGLRQGEALGLRWCDLDLRRSVLRVQHQLGRDQKLAEPKTREGQREVDLSPTLITMLREHKLRSQYSKPTDHTFCSADGGPLHYRTLAQRFQTPDQRAKLNGEGRPNLRWHDLRHTSASLLIAEGRTSSTCLGNSGTLTRRSHCASTATCSTASGTRSGHAALWMQSSQARHCRPVAKGQVIFSLATNWRGALLTFAASGSTPAPSPSLSCRPRARALRPCCHAPGVRTPV